MCPYMLSELLGRKEASQRDSPPEAEMKGQPWALAEAWRDSCGNDLGWPPSRATCS